MHKEREAIELKHHESQIWTRFGIVFLGLWLLTSPETFGYLHTVIGKSDWISGALLVLFGFISMSFKFRYWIWGGCLVGIWLQMAPLIFWAENPVIYVNDTLIGILAIAFALLVPLRPPQLELGPDVPSGWTYNPSSWQQRIPVIFFATIAWFLSRYLSTYQLHYTHEVWDPFFGTGTEKVITSIISEKFPVSDAGLGALAYSLEAILGAKGGPKRWHTMPWIVVIFGILVVPAGFVSIMLIMLQPIAVGAWCGICLLIAACMLMMLALTVDEMVAVMQFLKQSRKAGKPFLKTFFLGSQYTERGVDVRSPSFHSSPFKVIKSMFWGVTFPWTLIVTALLGVSILFSDNYFGYTGLISQISNVCGALIITFSIISFAEVIRSVRYLNILIALVAGAMPWVLGAHGMFRYNNIVTAILIILLTLPRGKVKEHYGFWDKKIF